MSKAIDQSSAGMLFNGERTHTRTTNSRRVYSRHRGGGTGGGGGGRSGRRSHRHDPYKRAYGTKKGGRRHLPHNNNNNNHSIKKNEGASTNGIEEGQLPGQEYKRQPGKSIAHRSSRVKRRQPERQHSQSSSSSSSSSSPSSSSSHSSSLSCTSSSSSSSSSQTSSTATGGENHRETDERKLAQRQKQIDYGKNTKGYDNYLRAVPRRKRHLQPRGRRPRTPDKYLLCSKRRFDGIVRAWRRALHEWDEKPKDQDSSAKSSKEGDGEKETTHQKATGSGGGGGGGEGIQMEEVDAILEQREEASAAAAGVAPMPGDTIASTTTASSASEGKPCDDNSEKNLDAEIARLKEELRTEFGMGDELDFESDDELL